MKLRNKKTGEIGYPYFQNWKEITCVIVDENAKQIAEYTSLAELNEEWEDAPEEPKEYYAIDLQGDIIRWARHSWDEKTTNKIKEIGNYFETKEEAEKAVEKLKAVKRLRDKGFRFCGWCEDIGFRFTKSGAWQTEVQPDLDLLFSQEDD